MEHMVPISEAKGRLSELVRDADDHEVLLMRHSRVAAVLISPARYEALLDELEDTRDALSVYESRESDADLRVPWEKAKIELGI
jgi:antitoxin StbD